MKNSSETLNDFETKIDFGMSSGYKTHNNEKKKSVIWERLLKGDPSSQQASRH